MTPFSLLEPVLERWAERYLAHRGRAILPRAFIGFAIGCGTASKTKYGSDHFEVWEVIVPKSSRIIALNHSVVHDGPEHT